ncbi:signal recognition particle protein [Serinibacter salmoneus]|uniref:Signal recognition particle protein n=1 Tax=Serinibacter salmoneus TaxID=556530 RepID=A0A2A9CXZ9_9MICO|nr:signal recognition particle protein [Serinibacter salmoneus]PFG19304.1 signal recognition particle subunit FFH/SRP54 (srp54) [Serinibacter salmoneus]
MFATLSDRITSAVANLRGRGRLSDAEISASIAEIRRALLDADVALPVVREFTASVREKAAAAELSQVLDPAQQIVKIVHEELTRILGGETRDLHMAKRGPTVIMLAGLQGAGKTTLAGKLGRWMKEQGHSPLLVASDLQRPNAVQQLEIVGKGAGVAVWSPEPGNGVGDPVEVARTGVAHAKEQYYDVVVVDTAGRLGVDAELMQQAADIRDAVQPNEILFVIDAMIGQDAVTTAQAFADGVGFTGVVLSKLDGDARGGAALSVASVTGAPVMFASTGEKVGDFERFHADRMASRILDMGDVMTLIEQAERAFDEEQAAELANKIAGDGDFTLEDFLQQMQQMKQLGSMKKMLGMLPGMGQIREQLENFDEREVDRVEAIVRSMTPAERRNPKLINGSRRSRIARGSGTTVTEINQLMQRFDQAKTMMRSMARGGGGMAGAMAGGGMPAGLGSMPGMGKKSKGRMAPQQNKRKKGKSGNPAKRAAQERAAAQKAEQRSPAGSAFGIEPQDGAPPKLDLPDGLGKFLDR